MKYRFIEQNRFDISVVKMCQTLSVSRSGFYSWLNRGVSDELLYTALTRAKEEILVINIGNKHFDSIFKACPHVHVLE